MMNTKIQLGYEKQDSERMKGEEGKQIFPLVPVASSKV